MMALLAAGTQEQCRYLGQSLSAPAAQGVPHWCLCQILLAPAAQGWPELCLGQSLLAPAAQGGWGQLLPIGLRARRL